jgi:REP-associated tyrosine transposase
MPLYHVWFSTKRRKWLLQGQVLDAAREEIAKAALQHSVRLIEHEPLVDHVHMLIEVDDARALAKAMNYVKGTSARRIFKRFPELKLDAHTTSFWQAHDGSKLISEEARAAVTHYIRTQWDRLEEFER